MTEIWRPVVGYEGQYQVSNLGNVKSLRRKCFAIHRLVAQAFLSNYNDSLEVNHKDENKANNHRKVLQYDLDGSLIKEWKNARIASETLGISHANIIVACRGYYTKNSRKYPVKSAYGYVWRYAD